MPASPALTESELDAITLEIARLERERQAYEERAGRLIVRMGRLLAKIKEDLGHGRWVKWADAHLPFSIDTAKNYLKVARHEPRLKKLLSLGKSALYELAEIAESRPEALKGLTPESRFAKKPLRELDCHEIKRALLPKEHPAKPSHTAVATDCLKTLAVIKRENPVAWRDIADDLIALVAGDARPSPAKPTGSLTGSTRNERAQNLFDQAQELLDQVDDVDDVAGKLSPDLKLKLMQITLVIWREVNKLPAVAHLPAGWKPSTGPVQGVVLRPR